MIHLRGAAQSILDFDPVVVGNLIRELTTGPVLRLHDIAALVVRVLHRVVERVGLLLQAVDLVIGVGHGVSVGVGLPDLIPDQVVASLDDGVGERKDGLDRPVEPVVDVLRLVCEIVDGEQLVVLGVVAELPGFEGLTHREFDFGVPIQSVEYESSHHAARIGLLDDVAVLVVGVPGDQIRR